MAKKDERNLGIPSEPVADEEPKESAKTSVKREPKPPPLGEAAIKAAKDAEKAKEAKEKEGENG